MSDVDEIDLIGLMKSFVRSSTRRLPERLTPILQERGIDGLYINRDDSRDNGG